MPELAELKFTSDYVNQVSEGATYLRVEKNPVHKCENLDIPFKSFKIKAKSKGKEMVLYFLDDYSDQFITVRITMGMSGHFKLTNSGLQMVLDVEVPNTIASHFPEIIHPFLAKNNFKIEDIDHLIFHPGGKKIIQTVEELFSNLGKNINDTKEILRLYGNMSSATVLYVLEQIMENNPQKGDLGLMLSFGPGFSAQRVLLKF